MELGNMCFGNSRGIYPIERTTGWEEVFSELLEELDTDTTYGINFENEVFFMMPYYWGDCTCGFENHSFKEEHRDNCYQILVDNELKQHGWFKKDGYLQSPKEMSYNEYSKIEDRVRQRTCKKLNLSYPQGCAVHCTCDYDKRFEEWLKKIGYPNGCKDDCMLRKPNFLYKSTGFKIEWYKYPFRDSYMNQNITKKEFRKIIRDCIKSIK